VPIVHDLHTIVRRCHSDTSFSCLWISNTL